MCLRFQASGQDGYEPIIQANSGLRYIGEFGVLRLPAAQSYAFPAWPAEALVHIIEGACDVALDGETIKALGTRPTPFAGPPAALYLPPHTAFQVVALGQGVELTVTVAAGGPTASGVEQPRVTAIRPESLAPKLVGRDNWARTVTLLAPPHFPAERLILGETFNPPGNWSGVPAHKHDTFRPAIESVHEELYYFRADPPGGWGFERVYDPLGRDELLLVQDRVVTLKPRGFHTVAAAPSCTLVYSFVLSGPERNLVPFIDPLQAELTA